MDMTKGFDEAKEEALKPAKNELQQQKDADAGAAKSLTNNISNVLSTGQIEVRIKKPRRKEAWARQGMIIGIRADFHSQKMWATVAYGAGIDKKINGKKQFVPYSDNYPLGDLEPIKVTELEQKPKDNE